MLAVYDRKLEIVPRRRGFNPDIANTSEKPWTDPGPTDISPARISPWRNV
jgi:hypothetical protein